MDISKIQKIYNDIDRVINSSMLDKYGTIEDIFTSLCGCDDEMSIFECAVNVLISLDKGSFYRKNLERYMDIFCGNAQMVKVLLNKQGEIIKQYHDFQLKWMAEHGYSLIDFLSKINDCYEELQAKEPVFKGCLYDKPSPDIWDAFDLFEEYGFKGGMIYPCFKEWVDNEGKVTQPCDYDNYWI